MIEDFKYPIFKYRGQITLHGIFNEFDTNLRIGSYKNLIINGNGSLGVKYNAIDHEKKRKLGGMLSYFGWFHHRDSSSEYYTKTFSSNPNDIDSNRYKTDAINQYNSIVIDKHYIVKNLFYNPLSGRIYLEVHIKALLESEINNLFSILTKKTLADLELAIEKSRIESEKRNLEYKKQREIEAQKTKEIIENSTLRLDVEKLPKWDREFKNDLHICFFDLKYNDKPVLKHWKLTKKGAWFTAKYFETENILDNVDFGSYLFSSTKRSGKTAIELVKNLGKYDFRVMS